MPSWNIHTAHVERLLEEHGAEALGIGDANAFLFGNYVPDIYVGFMVPDAAMRIDYCLTHCADPHATPTPDADRFWDECVAHPMRRASTPAGVSLTLGAWAHLVGDRVYNARFRTFSETRGLTPDDELRRRKQADFDLFGRSLDISLHVQATPALLEAAKRFRPYSILPEDARKAVAVADSIVEANGAPAGAGAYQLLDPGWMAETFAACQDRIASWLRTRARLAREGIPETAENVRAEAEALQGATPA